MKAYLKGYLKITDDKVASDYAPLSGEAVAPDPSAPVIVGLPVISGVERAGETLTATPASVTGYPTPDITRPRGSGNALVRPYQVPQTAPTCWWRRILARL
jgi:hypothetical protein